MLKSPITLINSVKRSRKSLKMAGLKNMQQKQRELAIDNSWEINKRD